MTALLHRLGFVYQQPQLVPGKADAKAQEALLAEYEKLKQDQDENDVIGFMDAVHPQHHPVLGYGWIKRGQDHEVKSNTGQRRVTINGVIDLERLEPVVRFDDTIDHRPVRATGASLCRRDLDLCHLRQRPLLPFQSSSSVSQGLPHQAGLSAALRPPFESA